MTDFLYSIDVAVFRFCNQSISCLPLDHFFGMITNVNNWMIAYIIIAGILLIKGGKKERVALLLTLIMIAMTDQFGYKVLKEFFHRPRPFQALQGVLLPSGEAGTYSFPSNHALNNFAIATLFSILYPGYRYALFITASLIAFSRVYLGVHYPSDIIGGALIGSSFGYLFSVLYTLIEKKFRTRQITD